MIEIEIQIPAIIQSNAIIRKVEQVCTESNLTLTLKGTLASYSGCVHWHFKKDKQAGILEITWWEKKHRLWFKVADHRTGAWIKEAIPGLKKKVEQAIHE